jgi:methylthioxylose transferase
MRHRSLIIVAIQAAVLAGFAVALRGGWFPLGVRGEWEWPRLKVSPAAIDVALAALGGAAYAGFVALGWRSISRNPTTGKLREVGWVAGLIFAGCTVQVILQSGAPFGYGLTKWVTLAMPGSSGYYTVAKGSMRDGWRFWNDYPTWIKKQDALHIGTHPPGLFLWSYLALIAMEASPPSARAITDHSPESVKEGFRQILRPLPRADRAALALTGALTLVMCAATCAPLYVLSRGSGMSPSASWAAASLWPVVPSAILFQPTADTAFPFLSTIALSLAIRRRPVSAIAAGAVLGVGMQFSLVFLPIGLVAALLIAGASGSSLMRRVSGLGWTGAGFLAVTMGVWALSRANPFVIWWVNQSNHARFYVQFPRSYLAWVMANPVELVVAMGLPVAIWVVLGIRRGPKVAWATVAVLIFLTASGKNLSEVARLWLPLMPPLLVSCAAAIERAGGRAGSLAATIGLMILQVLVLQATIQVVYPV